MPVKSKAQKRFMSMLAGGVIEKPGLSKAEAKEWLDATPKGKRLPERVTKKKSR